MTITAADIYAYVCAFGILGVLTLVLGYYLHGRLDGMIDDPKMPDRLSDDERSHRMSQLTTGVATMYIAGVLMLLAALTLFFVAR